MLSKLAVLRVFGSGGLATAAVCQSLSLLALAPLAFAEVPGHASVSAGERPNVLIVYVDDLGYGDTSAYGHAIAQTPHIDRLASEGARFTQFYAPSALCSPSRAGLLTGRTPYRTGVESWIPDESDVSLGYNEVTLADLAKQRGYRTAIIGKWHLNGGLHLANAPQPRDFGFDYQYGLAAWVKNSAVANSAGTPRNGEMFPDNMFRNNEPVGPTQKFSAELVSDDAIAWLDKDGTDPFFLLLTYSEVHTPIASPAAYRERYDAFLTAESRSNPLTYYFDWRDRPWRGRGEYYANISFLDAQLGRVLEYLRDRGALDNTLVVFSSDNGPVTDAALTPWELGMAGETAGLRGKKRFLFEGGIRVPGILRYPAKIRARQVFDAPVTALDLFPTLAETLSAETDESVPIDGQSLWPLLTNHTLNREKPLYWSIPTPDGMEFAVRDGDWKLILTGDGEPAYLFNLAVDHYEVDNRLQTNPQELQRLLAAFNAARAAIASDPLAAARAAAP
ncbi:MAG: sulfatase [Congregibacter sp.]